MTTEYYFECSECGRWYEDESSLAHDDVCIHCTVSSIVTTVMKELADEDTPF